MKKKEEKSINKQLRNEKSSSSEFDRCKELVLLNDDEHSFDYVIDALMEVCFHNAHQAEQCALITHYKGKCQIKQGKYNELRLMRKALMQRELKATVI